jgi:hypothetical protein
MTMKNFHVTIMSIDPDDHYGREQGDDHQKYGLRVMATDKNDAETKGVEQFKKQYGNLPIFWVKSFEEVIYDPNKPTERIYD